MLALLMACAPPKPPMEPVERPWPEVDEVVLRAFDEGRVVGAAVAIVMDGDLVYARGYGWAGQDRPVEAARTLFRVGSMSKGLTGLGLAIADAEGLLDLDADVAPLVPSWTPPRVLAREGELPIELEEPPVITLRQLMAHLGGLTRMRDLGKRGVPDTQALRAHEGDRDFTWAFDYWADEPLAWAPGERFHYSTYGVNLAGAALESATGEALDDWLRWRLLAPLDVDLAGIRPEYWWQDIPERSDAHSYHKGGIRKHEGVDYSSAALPGAGYLSTAVAWAQLCQAFAEDRVPQAWARAFTTRAKDAGGELVDYGLGVGVRRLEDGRRAIGHVGGMVGGSSKWVYVPEDKACVVLLTNTKLSDAPERVDELVEILL